MPKKKKEKKKAKKEKKTTSTSKPAQLPPEVEQGIKTFGPILQQATGAPIEFWLKLPQILDGLAERQIALEKKLDQIVAAASGRRPGVGPNPTPAAQPQEEGLAGLLGDLMKDPGSRKEVLGIIKAIAGGGGESEHHSSTMKIAKAIEDAALKSALTAIQKAFKISEEFKAEVAK